jgi:hypothetical protein
MIADVEIEMLNHLRDLRRMRSLARRLRRTRAEHIRSSADPPATSRWDVWEATPSEANDGRNSDLFDIVEHSP